MTPQILLEKFRYLMTFIPPLEGRGQYGMEQYVWLGKASALISLGNKNEALAFKFAADAIAGNINRTSNYGVIMTSLYRTISLLEESIPLSEQQIFGPGATYDFFKALNEVITSCEKSVFLIDPYMDAEVFDGYLSSLTSHKNVRLLINKYTENVQTAIAKYSSQYSTKVEARKSLKIHDRLVFVDNSECWVLGASIKDAATKKPTYLAPLSADVVQLKLAFYESIWADSEPI